MTPDIIPALTHRYATQVFDTTKGVSDSDLHTILESARLAPSSFGLEPWKFIVVTNPETRAKLREVGYGQPKITEASHLVVIAYRTDGDTLVEELIDRTVEISGKTREDLAGLEQMVSGAMKGRDDQTRDAWLKAQAYIPLGMMIETAALIGVDTGPMEGFDAAAVDQILGLTDKHLHATSMLAIGYRGDDTAAARPKVRRAYDDVVEIVD